MVACTFLDLYTIQKEVDCVIYIYVYLYGIFFLWVVTFTYLVHFIICVILRVLFEIIKMINILFRTFLMVVYLCLGIPV